MTHSARRRVAEVVFDGTNAATAEGRREALPAEVVRLLIEFDPDVAA